jgi:hypothetical protein
VEIPELTFSAHEEDLKDPMDAIIEEYPETVAVLVRRHGIYGTTLSRWGANRSLGKYVGAGKMCYGVH